MLILLALFWTFVKTKKLTIDPDTLLLTKLQASFGFHQFFYICPFTVPGFNPEYHIVFSYHVSLSQRPLTISQSFLVFITLTLLSSTGQVFSSMFLKRNYYYLCILSISDTNCVGFSPPPHANQLFDTSRVSYNWIQFWHYLPGVSVRFHSLRAQSYKTAPHFRRQFRVQASSTSDQPTLN